MSLWSLLGAPLVEVLLIVGIHTYLGLHVLRRGIIFVDLALAQIAAFGALVAFLVGLEPGSAGASVFAFVFAVLGAALFAALRPGQDSRVPQEAFIGLVYACTSALALLLMAKAPQGAEHLRETMTGTLLWVQWPTVLEAALLFGGVAAVHVWGRKKFLAISESADKKPNSMRRVIWWDFVFYATFAVVVTHAVKAAGVLLVFVFLVAPASLAMLWFSRFVTQLIFGWVLGAFVCLVGLGVSYNQDLPSAPTVIAVYAAVLLVVGFVRWTRPPGEGFRPRRFAAAAGTVTLAVGLLSLVHALAPDHAHGHGLSDQDDDHPMVHASGLHGDDAADTLAESVAAADLPEEKVAVCAQASTAAELQSALEKVSGGFDQLALAQCLSRLDASAGHAALQKIAKDQTLPPFVRMEAEAAGN